MSQSILIFYQKYKIVILWVYISILRGDYVKLGLVVCDIHYYERCMQKMMDMSKKSHFFIFSDDISWVKTNLKFKGSELIFIDNNNSSLKICVFYIVVIILSCLTFPVGEEHTLANIQIKSYSSEFWSIKKKKVLM